MERLLNEIRNCTLCAAHLPMGPRPIVSASANARIMIIGQAPGTRVHNTGIPWNDPSGRQLRDWLSLDEDTFYDSQQVAIMPMGFCYPGSGKSGDLPPRPECAPAWHSQLLAHMPNLRLTLLIGQYAQRYYLGNKIKKNLTETVRHFQDYAPLYLPLPHPSPRNRIWLKRNPWFGSEVVPVLKNSISAALKS